MAPTIDPVHPGEHLAEMMEEYGLSQYRVDGSSSPMMGSDLNSSFKCNLMKHLCFVVKLLACWYEYDAC